VGDGVWGRGIVFFIVDVYDVDGGDKWSAYFEDLDIWVRTYIGSGGDSKVWVAAGHIGGSTVRFSVTAGGQEEEKVRVCFCVPGVLDVNFLDQDDVIVFARCVQQGI
jgi:hypothetical protein